LARYAPASRRKTVMIQRCRSDMIYDFFGGIPSL
jgi:hypothetical protein